MAYFMSFLALFLFADQLTAQIHREHGPDLCLKRLEYENSSGEIALTTFDYNNEGIMTEAFWETHDGSRNSNNFYKYDEAGKLISCYREFSDHLTSYEFYLYNDEGQKTHETFVRSDGIIGTADYVYDKKGRCKEVICDHYKGWINGIIKYQYKKNGPAKEAEIVRDDKSIGNIIFEYDKDGNLIKDIWTFSSGWQQIFIYHYESVEG